VKKLQLFKITAALLSAATIITASPFVTGLSYASADSNKNYLTAAAGNFSSTQQVECSSVSAQQDKSSFLSTQQAATYAESAQSNATIYPQDFFKQLTFTSLSDYAICGDTYAFAQGTSVYIVGGEDDSQTLIDHNCGFEIKSLNYINDTLYLSDADGNYFFIDGTSAAKPENSYNDTSITVGGITYFLEATGTLHCFGNGSLQSVGEGYSHLKGYNTSAYAIKDNKLYKIDGTNVEELEFYYTDFSAASTIKVGDAYTNLKATYVISTVNVESGAYCTEIDLNETAGNYFTAVKTIQLSGAKSALLLATSGNASIIAMNDGDYIKSYLTLSSALTPAAYHEVDTDMTAGYSVMDVGVYSSPYISEATKLTTLPRGTVVQISQKFSLSFMGTDYYKITFSDNDKDVTGYVPTTYFTPYTFSQEFGEEESIKTDYDYSTNIERVILVLIIVGLVIAAIAYLAIVGTKPKKISDKKKSYPTDTSTDYPTAPDKTYQAGFGTADYNKDIYTVKDYSDYDNYDNPNDDYPNK
jgi:hypothetical protein